MHIHITQRHRHRLHSNEYTRFFPFFCYFFISFSFFKIISLFPTFNTFHDVDTIQKHFFYNLFIFEQQIKTINKTQTKQASLAFAIPVWYSLWCCDCVFILCPFQFELFFVFFALSISLSLFFSFLKCFAIFFCLGISFFNSVVISSLNPNKYSALKA